MLKQGVTDMSMIGKMVSTVMAVNFWIHRTCAGLSKSRKEYENLQKYGSDKTWYCRPCKEYFPILRPF